MPPDPLASHARNACRNVVASLYQEAEVQYVLALDHIDSASKSSLLEALDADQFQIYDMKGVCYDRQGSIECNSKLEHKKKSVVRSK